MTDLNEKQQLAMLAAQNCTLDDIEFPCWISTKFDGIRCLTAHGVGRSRENLVLPNRHLQSLMASLQEFSLDGEIIVGDPNAEDCYNKTQSAVSTHEGQPDFRYYVFDEISNPGLPFVTRQRNLKQLFDDGRLPSFCILVLQQEVESKVELVEVYEALVEAGHEGVITRRGSAPYRRGRGTKKAQDMIKLKPREDSEFEVMGFEELLRNTNEATISETGHTKRSSAKAGKVAGGTLGKILARDIHSGERFKIGTFKGLKAKDKKEIWDNQDKFMSRIGVYSFCPVGVKKLPRHPSFKGWRDTFDIGAA